MARLTPEDITSAKYFILERGDITRWSAWEEKKAIFKAEYPQLLRAINLLEFAKTNLRLVAELMKGE